MRLVVTVLSSILLLTILAPAAAKPIKVLIVDGQSGGPYHNWQRTTEILKKELEETGIFDVSVATAPANDGDFSGFKPEYTKYQAVVWNLDAPDWPSAQRAALEAYVKSGGGLVIVHAANNSFPDWPEFNRMTGIGGWRKRTETAGPMWYYKDGKLHTVQAGWQ